MSALGAPPRCPHPVTAAGGVQLDTGHELHNCLACRTTLARPLPWVSPYPEDYIPGHQDNAWGVFTEEAR